MEYASATTSRSAVYTALDAPVPKQVNDVAGSSPLSEVPEEMPRDEKPKAARRSRKRKAVEVKASGTNQVDEENTGPKQSRRRRKTKKPVDSGEEGESSEAREEPKRTRRRKNVQVSTVTAAAFESEQGIQEEKKVKKKRRRKTPEEDKMYDIPPIGEVLSTTFKGRLGYACLNSLLRSYSTSIFCSRTCRLATLVELGPEHVRSLALQNLADLHTLIKWNVEHSIFFMRMSSEMFPFASHPEHGYDLAFADAELKEIGATARKLGVRLTSHPGQFTQLGSPTKKVVDNAFRDLIYHCEIMDRMSLDQDSIMIIHMGGMYGDKLATLERFKENYVKLPENVKGRLVLENDEMCYNVDDLLPICRELNIPLVFDYHHDWIYPSSRPPVELIPEINQLWHDKGIRPKQHYSEPRPGAQTVMEKRAHSDRVARLPEALPDDMDLMLECKDKEQAVFHLYRLYGLREVDARVLRPPADVESMHTKGRKSTKRARAKAAAAADAVAKEDEDETGVEVVAGIEVEGEKREDGVHLEAGLAREAEEHGVPPDVAARVVDSGGPDCGSGDEEVEDVSAAKVKSAPRKTKAGRPARRLHGKVESVAQNNAQAKPAKVPKKRLAKDEVKA